MRIEFTGRKTEVPEPLRKLGERKLSKLARVLPGITRAHVILSTDRHRQVAEVNVRSPRLDLAAQEASADFGASLAAAFDKLTRQAQHRVGKRLDRKRRGRPAAPAVGRPRTGAVVAEGVRRAAEPTRRIYGIRRVALKPMTAEQAALEMDRKGEAFVLFRDAATGRLLVLHRRKDGFLGLLEPEA
jgi:putative sigma-54 modulation protein